MPKAWTNVALANDATATGLSLQAGSTYFINVRAISSIGKAGAVGSSDGILVDMTPPSKPIVTDGGAYRVLRHSAYRKLDCGRLRVRCHAV